MAQRPTIVAAPRTVLGKKVRQIRREGQLPANVYGRNLASQALQLDAREFSRHLKSHGARGMFELRIDGEGDPRYVVLRGIMRKGGTGDPIHVDFYQVDLNRPVQANVTVRLTGEAPAVRDLAGTLIQNLDTVVVRCLPLEIPEIIEVDAGALKSFDVTITVADITLPAGVEMVTDPAINVATVNPPRIRVATETETE
jgi:large subunit ribosomal protein L25